MSPDVIQTNRINLKYERYYNMEIITFRQMYQEETICFSLNFQNDIKLQRDEMDKFNVGY